VGTEVGVEGRGVGVEGRRRADVPELPDGVETAVPVGVEVSLDAGPGRPGQADDLGPGDAVGDQPEDLHPPLHPGRRVVEPIVGDRGQDGRGEGEGSHGVLPVEVGMTDPDYRAQGPAKSSLLAARGITNSVLC
jgi:hypothetical protein